MADRVIEVDEVASTMTLGGTSKNITWIYRKWSSGKKEAWFNWNSASVACNTQHTNGYRSAEFVANVPDIGFSDPKICVMAHNSGTYVSTIFVDYYDSTNKQLHFYVYCGASQSSSSSRYVETHIFMTEG